MTYWLLFCADRLPPWAQLLLIVLVAGMILLAVVSALIEER